MTAAFRLVTFNLWNDPASWPRRAPLAARQLAALAPDIVALQEVGVPDEQTGPLIAALGAATELPFRAASCEMSRPDGWSEGIAVLSSVPVQASDSLAVDEGGTVCLWARVSMPNGRSLDLYDLHLNPHDLDLQHRQIEAILDWTRSHAGADARILCGDFNARPESDTIRRVADAGFASAHALHHGAEPARTFPTPLRPEVYASRPASCLDYIFVESAALDVRACRVALDQPAPDDPSLFPSDHAALVADLAWR